MKHAKISHFTVILFLFLTGHNFAQMEWTHVVNHPVLDHGPKGAWDSGSVIMPHIIKDGDTLKMWYGGHDDAMTEGATGAGYAWSLDGITWQRHNDNPLPTLGGEGAGPVIKENGLYKMWCGDGSVISYAFSSDGINWEIHPESSLQKGPTGDWDSDALILGAGSVIKTDSLYLMWYHGYKGQAFPNGYVNLGLATSIDGIHWSKYDDPQTTEPPFAASDPVVHVGESGTWEEAHLKGACVLQTHNGFELWYSGLNAAATGQKLGYAISSDGISWIKYPHNPIIHDPPDWGKLGYLPGTVLKIDGLYHMWYASFGDLGNYPRIGYATSPVINHDLAVISSPAHLASAPIYARGIRPTATVKNFGRFNESAVTVLCEIDSAGNTVYSDSQMIETLQGKNFAAEEMQVIYKEWRTFDRCNYDVFYYTQLGDDDDCTNDTLRTSVVVDTLVENFEAGLKKWSLDTCWTTTSKAHSGVWALVSTDGGTYPNNINSAATFDYSFDLSGLSDAYLSFWTIYALMPNDFGFVEISIDDGANWVQIGEPLTGTQLSPWRRDMCSLSDFCGPGITAAKIRFRLETDAENTSIGWFIDDITLVPEKMPVTQARQDLKRPGIYVLEQNYPNPFNPITVINFIIPREEFIRLEIFNLLGERVELLIADRVAEGSHSYTWDANDLPNGVYLYRLTTADFLGIRKMLLVR